MLSYKLQFIFDFLNYAFLPFEICIRVSTAYYCQNKLNIFIAQRGGAAKSLSDALLLQKHKVVLIASWRGPRKQLERSCALQLALQQQVKGKKTYYSFLPSSL